MRSGEDLVLLLGSYRWCRTFPRRAHQTNGEQAINQGGHEHNAHKKDASPESVVHNFFTAGLRLLDYGADLRRKLQEIG